MFTDHTEEEFIEMIQGMPDPEFTDWYAKNKNEFSDQEMYHIGQELKRRDEDAGSTLTRQAYKEVEEENLRAL